MLLASVRIIELRLFFAATGKAVGTVVEAEVLENYKLGPVANFD